MLDGTPVERGLTWQGLKTQSECFTNYCVPMDHYAADENYFTEEGIEQGHQTLVEKLEAKKRKAEAQKRRRRKERQAQAATKRRNERRRAVLALAVIGVALAGAALGWAALSYL